MALQNCYYPSGRALVLALVLTLLTLAIWGDQGPDFLEDPVALFSKDVSTISQPMPHPFHNFAVRTSQAFTNTLHNFQIIATRVVNFSRYLATRFDTPWHYIFSKPSQRAFLPSSYYETDRHGAIEIFEKHGMTVCRLYKVCRLQNGHLELPEWAESHSKLVTRKCGLPNLQFKPTWTLRSRFGDMPYYDWLGPDVPTHALLEFTRVPLSYFFASRSARRSILNDTTAKNRVKRTCLSPGKEGYDRKPISRICDNKAEGRISNPAFLVNIGKDESKADKAFQDALTAEFLKVHGVEADVFDSSSALLKYRKACFRSVIVAPGFAHKRYGENGLNAKAVSASQVAAVISAAERIIHGELNKNGNATKPKQPIAMSKSHKLRSRKQALRKECLK